MFMWNECYFSTCEMNVITVLWNECYYSTCEINMISILLKLI